MYIAEFVLYDNFMDGQPEKTVSNILKLKLDPMAVQNIDYFSQESRLATIEFWADDWFLNKLDTLDLDIIGDKFWKYALRLRDNDEIIYIGWISRDGISYNRKTQKMHIRAADHIALLSAHWDEDAGLISQGFNAISKLTGLLTELLAPTQIDVPVFVDLSEVHANIGQVPMYWPTVIDQNTNYLENFTKAHGGYHEDSLHEYIDWRILKKMSSEVIYLVMVSWKRNKGTGYEEIKRLSSSINIFTLQGTLIGPTYYLEHKGIPEGSSSLYQTYYLNAGYSSYEYDCFTAVFGNMTLTLDMSHHQIYKSGEIPLTNPILLPKDPAHPLVYQYYQYKNIIKSLMLLCNAILIIYPEGIYIKRKDAIESGNIIPLNSNELIEYEVSAPQPKVPNLDSLFRIYEFGEQVVLYLMNYYEDQLKCLKKYKIQTIQKDIQFGDILQFEGKQMLIRSILTDTDNFVTTIEAWSINESL